MRTTLIATIVGLCAYCAGYASKYDSASPTDNTGIDSIVVYMDGMGSEHWVELRGPARWDALESFADPIEWPDWIDSDDPPTWDGFTAYDGSP